MSRTLQKSCLALFQLLNTLGALAAVCCWAVSPFFMVIGYIWSGSEADLIRQLFPFRVVQPEWLSSPDYGHWIMVETSARLTAVFLLWAGISALIAIRYRRISQSAQPTHPVVPTPAPAF